MSTYTATAHREGDWWVIDVEGVGVTQAKRLDQVEGMARDMVALMLDVDISTVQVDVHPEVGPELDGLVLSARTAADAAKQAQARATETSRATAKRLADAGYSLRDIGILTGVSYQRIHQLLGEGQKRSSTQAETVRVGRIPVKGTTKDGGVGDTTTKKAHKGPRRTRVDA